jgi:ankyrin repeat protein
MAILWASENGQVEVVKLLLNDNRVDAPDDNNNSILCASANGHTRTKNQC